MRDRTCRFAFRASGKILSQTAVKPEKGPFIERKYVYVYVYIYICMYNMVSQDCWRS